MSGPRGSSIKRDISCAADSPPTDRKVSKSSINIWGCVMLDATDYYEEVRYASGTIQVGEAGTL